MQFSSPDTVGSEPFEFEAEPLPPDVLVGTDEVFQTVAAAKAALARRQPAQVA